MQNDENQSFIHPTDTRRSTKNTGGSTTRKDSSITKTKDHVDIQKVDKISRYGTIVQEKKDKGVKTNPFKKLAEKLNQITYYYVPLKVKPKQKDFNRRKKKEQPNNEKKVQELNRVNRVSYAEFTSMIG